MAEVGVRELKRRTSEIVRRGRLPISCPVPVDLELARLGAESAARLSM